MTVGGRNEYIIANRRRTEQNANRKNVIEILLIVMQNNTFQIDTNNK